VTPPPALSADFLGWAQFARFVLTTADDGDMMFRSEKDPSTSYFIRRRGPDRLELTQADEDGTGERPLLFVARIEVIERHLLGVFADDIRDDLDLPFLRLPYTAEATAPGFELSGMARGYRTLTRTGHGPVAAAPDPTLSMVTLVPLSHLLLWPTSDVKAAFMNESGAPLLHDGGYVPPPAET
jgi:hypothetical protein